MALIRHSAKWGVAVGVSPLRRHKKRLHAGGLIQPQRRGEASSDGSKREATQLFLGCFAPTQTTTPFKPKQKLPVCASLLCQVQLRTLTHANPDGRRGEASIYKRNGEGNAIVLGCFAPTGSSTIFIQTKLRRHVCINACNVRFNCGT